MSAIIGLEEHTAPAAVLDAWRESPELMSNVMMQWTVNGALADSLQDVSEGRLRAMDAAGVDIAVLSVSSPGLQAMPARQAVALQQPVNDAIADAVRHSPSRLQGFATLATPDPAAAARELERAVVDLGLNGVMLHTLSEGRFLDEDRFLEIFEVAAAHHVPVYLHPSEALGPVDTSYYRGFGEQNDAVLASGAPGWHYQTGLGLLRMILAGVFDRFPDLQVILGHWGEMMLFYLDRLALLDPSARLERPVAEYFRSNVLVTPGGIMSQRYLRWALEVVGPDRVLHATDYPFNGKQDGFARKFLEQADLSQADRDAIGSGNWERIVAGIRR